MIKIISLHERLSKSLKYRLQPALFKDYKFFILGNKDLKKNFKMTNLINSALCRYTLYNTTCGKRERRESPSTLNFTKKVKTKYTPLLSHPSLANSGHACPSVDNNFMGVTI